MEAILPILTIPQLTEMSLFVNIGTKPPNTIAVNTNFDKSKKYLAITSLVSLALSFTSFFYSCLFSQFPISILFWHKDSIFRIKCAIMRVKFFRFEGILYFCKKSMP